MTRKNNGFSFKDGVDLQTFFEREIAHVREIFDKDSQANATALSLAHEANAEHFKLLNNEASRILQVQNAMLPKEYGELKFKSHDDAIAEIRVWIAGQVGGAKQSDVNRATAFGIVALVATLINILLSLPKLFGQ